MSQLAESAPLLAQSTDRPSEITAIHTRLQKCTLEVENSRAYWQHADPEGERASAQVAFEEYWFGARSLPRVKVLLASFRTRFDAFPAALSVLRRWTEMEPDTRRLICHWHLQLSDPLYRAFTGNFLVQRRDLPRSDITQELAIRWTEQQAPGRWSPSTLMQFGSRLLSCAHGAGLVTAIHDPRPLAFPRVEAPALGYLMYLLRGVDFAGTLLDNPYTASVGLSGRILEERLRSLPGMSFRRQGALVDFSWSHDDLAVWAARGVL